MATNLSAFAQTALFKVGRTAEQRVGDLLRRRGWYVIPSYDYIGDEQKAPRLQGPYGIAWVLPDLDVSRGGVRRWVEVKYKTSANVTRSPSRRVRPDCELEHGINLRHARHYRRIREETGCDVWLCIYESNTKEVLLQNLAVLEQPDTKASGGRRWHRIVQGCPLNESDRDGMFFFSRADMISLGVLAD